MNWNLVNIRTTVGNVAGSEIAASLGPKKINQREFADQVNKKVLEMRILSGTKISVLLRYFPISGKPSKFEIVKIKTESVANLIKSVLGIQNGSKTPAKNTVAEITIEQVREIAKKKFEQTSAATMEGCISMIIGTAHSIGVKVK